MFVPKPYCPARSSKRAHGKRRRQTTRPYAVNGGKSTQIPCLTSSKSRPLRPARECKRPPQGSSRPERYLVSIRPPFIQRLSFLRTRRGPAYQATVLINRKKYREITNT